MNRKMLSVFLTLALLVFPAVSSLQAQSFSTAEEALEHVETNAQEVFAQANQALGQANALNGALASGNAGQVQAHANAIYDLLSLIEERSDEINWGAFRAGQLAPGLDVSGLTFAGVWIEANEDFASNGISAMLTAFGQGDLSGAETGRQDAIAALQVIRQLADDARREARSLKKTL